jgi:hypothetical protein
MIPLVLAEPAEVIVEGAVLLHHDNNVIDGCRKGTLLPTILRRSTSAASNFRHS